MRPYKVDLDINDSLASKKQTIDTILLQIDASKTIDDFNIKLDVGVGIKAYHGEGDDNLLRFAEAVIVSLR